MIKIEYILSFWFQIDMNISSREEPDIKPLLLFFLTYTMTPLLSNLYYFIDIKVN